MTSEQLAKIEAPITEIQAFNSWYEEAKTHAFILCPVTRIDSIPDVFQISRRMVLIDPTVPGINQSGAQVYHSALFHGENKGQPTEVSLGKVAILQLLGAAGGSIISSARMDDRSDPLLCEFTVVAAVQDFDGVWRQMPGTKTIDLHDGTPEALGLKGGLNAARKNIVRLCEAKAMEAAVRALLGLQQKYSVADLRTKPFIIPKLVLNGNHPDVRQHLIKSAAGPQAALYGAPTSTGDVVAALPEAAPEKPAPPPATEEPTEDDMPDLPPPEEEAVIICGCPCGHGVEVKTVAATAGMDRLGCVRCARCWPGGKSYDVEAHKHLGKLGIKKSPDLTAEKAAEMKKGGGR